MRVNSWCIILCILMSVGLSRLSAAQEKAQSPSQEQSAAKAQPEDLAAIRRNVQAFVTAFDQGDAKAVAELWTEKGEFVDDQGVTFTGRDAIEQSYSEFFRSEPNAKIQINVDSLRLLSDTVAMEEGTTLVETPYSVATLGRYQAIHVKVGGKWLMASVRDTLDETTIVQQNLADLDWLIGTWLAEEHGNKYESVCHWVSNQSFVQRDFKVTRFDGAKSSGVQLIGWNPQGGYMQSWTFSPDGGHAVGTWAPIEGGWTAQMQGMTGDGISTMSTILFKRLDDNAYVWQSVDRSVGGAAIPDTEEVVLKRQPVSE